MIGAPYGPFSCPFACQSSLLAQNTISEQVRSSGSFAPAQEVAETSSSLERLVAFTGRTVHA